MEKITRIALSYKFREEDLDNVMEILKATGNVPVATEILLGIYEEPEIKEFSEDTRYETNRTFISYDKFKDQVTYSYNSVKTKAAWFKKKEEDLSEKNIVSKKSWKGELAEEKGIPREDIDLFYKWAEYERDVSPELRTSTVQRENW